jgi:hypothetical protein
MLIAGARFNFLSSRPAGSFQLQRAFSTTRLTLCRVFRCESWEPHVHVNIWVMYGRRDQAAFSPVRTVCHRRCCCNCCALLFLPIPDLMLKGFFPTLFLFVVKLGNPRSLSLTSRVCRPKRPLSLHV